MVDGVSKVSGLLSVRHLDRGITGLGNTGSGTRRAVLASSAAESRLVAAQNCEQEAAVLAFKAAELHAFEQEQAPSGDRENNQQPDDRVFDGFKREAIRFMVWLSNKGIKSVVRCAFCQVARWNNQVQLLDFEVDAGTLTQPSWATSPCLAGTKLQRLTAARAASSSWVRPLLFCIWISPGLPLANTCTRSNTVPSQPLRMASDGYSGAGLCK